MLRPLARALLALGLAASAGAQSPAVAPVPATPAPAGADPVNVPGRPLSLEECIALAMKKNFDLQIQGYNTQVARENLIIQESAFLPTFNASTDRRISHSTLLVVQPSGETLVLPRDTNSTTFSAGVSERIPQTNGTISVNGNVSRGSTQRPPFSTDVGATLNQPLLQNAGRSVARANLERAKIGLTVAQINYRSRVLAVIRDTENAYYDLVAAREALRIRQLTFQTNQRLFEENQIRRTTGVATDLDVLSAEVGVANARRALVQAEQLVAQREDALLLLINAFHPDARPGPVSFADYAGGVPTFAQSYKRARDNYPDTLSAEQTLRQLEIDVATAKRNRLPSLNLVASIGYSNTDAGGYFDVLSALPDDHGDSRRLSLTYSMPWGMRENRARHRSAVANLNSQKLRLEQLELSLLVQVRNAVRAVETNLIAVEIAAKASELAMREAEQQKARFDAGLATSRLVLEAQDRLEQARLNELNAKVQLRGALAELHRLEGTSIERFGVRWQE